MLKENCRIENYKGIRFYEKDVLHDDYVFNNDIKLEVDLTYIFPGFGIALMGDEGYSIKEKNGTYLFKIGYKEASVYYSDESSRTLIKQITLPEAVTVQDSMKFKLLKQGKKVSVYLNDKFVFEEYLKRELDRYNVGYYSNAGNIINSINIAANVPDNFVVNMANTSGGYINFSKDTFELTDCTNNAEIEQQNIFLTKGVYYFNAELLNGSTGALNDIKYYVVKSNDDRYFDEEKNILKKDNSFILLEDQNINIKYVGKNGRVRNMFISKSKNDDYVSTTSEILDFEGSQIEVLIQDLSKIIWKGKVLKTPYSISNLDVVYALIMDNKEKVTPEDASIKIGDKEYRYEFSTIDFTFRIYDDNTLIFSKKLTSLSNKVTIFKNINAVISEMTIYKKNGAVVNVNVQDEYKQYINGNINSPIIVIDQYGSPFDLSSSYRKAYFEGYSKYIFTNWEREYFYPEKIIQLEKSVINKQDSIIIYGVKSKNIDLDLIYDIKEENINSIDLMTRDYDVMYEKDLIYIDKIQNTLYLSDEQIKKYDFIIIDYLKNNSYSINYHFEKDSYEVDISTLDDKTEILYNTNEIDAEGNFVTQVDNYKVTGISGNINGYVVLQKGGL